MAKKTYHHGALREALLEAALEVITTEGARALTLRAVARQAGVSHTAPYRHFTDKEALLAAVAEEGFRHMRAEMVAAARQCTDSPVAAFRALGETYIRFALRNDARYRVMFGGDIEDRSRHTNLHEAEEATFELLAGAIGRCQEAGFIRPGDPRELGFSAWSMVHGFALLVNDRHLAGKGYTGARLDDMIALIIDSTFLGLGTR